jgi:hypothetical protein
VPATIWTAREKTGPDNPAAAGRLTSQGRHTPDHNLRLEYNSAD